MPSIAALFGATAAGKSTPAKPTLTYRGSYLSNNGKFQITNFDSALLYTTSGGTVSFDTGLSCWIFTVTATTGGATLYATTQKSPIASPTVTAFRHVADQTAVAFTQCYNPCGNCNTSINPNTWSCGCGSGCNDSGGGQWGACICRGPGYSYWNDYSGSGYTWSGAAYASDGSNGEWWKIA